MNRVALDPTARRIVEALAAACIDLLDAADAPMEDLEPEEDHGDAGEEEPYFSPDHPLVRHHRPGTFPMLRRDLCGSDLESLI